LFLGKKKNKISNNVKKILENEKLKNFDNVSSCLQFKKDCELSRKKIVDLLNKYKQQGKKICGYAATSKSTTLLNYCKINSDFINCIYDTTKEKIGKYSPGTHIPIVKAENFKLDKPDIAYLFAWNHKKEILNKEKQFLNQGGKWISHVEI